MNPKSSTVYAGLDVSKATLQLHLQNHDYKLTNDRVGHAKLIALLRAVPACHLILEATGGYEAQAVRALHAAKLPLSVINPMQTRSFARATGQRAKNDPLDAAGLSAFGRALEPAPTPALDTFATEMAALVRWRDQLKAALVIAKNQGAHLEQKFVCREHSKYVEHLEKRLALVTQELLKLVESHKEKQAQLNCLTQISGVGVITALSVLSYMPELGTLNRAEAASLAGLCPWTRQSGTWEGARHIGGGRAGVRRALYMSAVAAVRSNRRLKAFYQRLRAADKKPKVALTAVMRKLIVLMNRALKDPNFSLAQ